jgi:hypothetical protein
MNGRLAVSDAADMQGRRLAEFDLQAVAVGDQEQGGIAMAVPSMRAVSISFSIDPIYLLFIAIQA